MEIFKKISLVFVIILGLSSCNSNRKMDIHKIPLPIDNFCSTERGCMEAYSIENIDLGDKDYITSINRFVSDNYDAKKAKEYKVYSIVFYAHDDSEFKKLSETNSQELYKRSIDMPIIFSYTWQDGSFKGLSTYENNVEKESNIPVPILEKSL